MLFTWCLYIQIFFKSYEWMMLLLDLHLGTQTPWSLLQHLFLNNLFGPCVDVFIIIIIGPTPLDLNRRGVCATGNGAQVPRSSTKETCHGTCCCTQTWEKHSTQGASDSQLKLHLWDLKKIMRMSPRMKIIGETFNVTFPRLAFDEWWINHEYVVRKTDNIKEEYIKE